MNFKESFDITLLFYIKTQYLTKKIIFMWTFCNDKNKIITNSVIKFQYL